jgi:hypothetical protein
MDQYAQRPLTIQHPVVLDSIAGGRFAVKPLGGFQGGWGTGGSR